MFIKLRWLTITMLLPVMLLAFLLFFARSEAANLPENSRIYLVRDIVEGSGHSQPFRFTVLDNRFFFYTGGAFSSDDLWVSDGTTAGTHLVYENISPNSFGRYGNEMFFSGINEGGAGFALWKSDGTLTGTMMVKPFSGSNQTYLTEAAGLLFFLTLEAPYGMDLWRTDGTLSGTVLVEDTSHGDGWPSYLTAYDNRVFFTAYENNNDFFQLWVSDGTTDGTHRFIDINPTGDSGPDSYTIVNNLLFFVADNGTTGWELWRSDGTITGTFMLNDINSLAGSDPNTLHPVGSLLYFFANDGIHGEELWRTDGTMTGTVMVKDITPGVSSTPIYGGWTTATQDMYFFVVDDPATGRELWVSDGTVSGTKLVKEINPTGDAITDYESVMISSESNIYFSATDGVHGVELWQSDGTAEGTFMVEDLNPNGNAFPTFDSYLIIMNDILYFSATDGETGYELWALSLTPAVYFAQENINVPEASGTAVIEVTLSQALTNTVSIHYETVGGSAQAGSDYLPVSGTLTIPAGIFSGTISVPLQDDLIPDSGETIVLHLSKPVGVVLGKPLTTTVTLIDSDSILYLPIVNNNEPGK